MIHNGEKRLSSPAVQVIHMKISHESKHHCVKHIQSNKHSHHVCGNWKLVALLLNLQFVSPLHATAANGENHRPMNNNHFENHRFQACHQPNSGQSG
jgi:hypothetical protein